MESITNIEFLTDIGQKIKYLMRTVESYDILNEESEGWDEGGCAMFTLSIFPFLQKEGYKPVIYTLTNKDNYIGHFVVKSNLNGLYLDSEGWNTKNQLIERYPKYKLQIWNKEEQNIGDIICDWKVIVKLIKFLSKYLYHPFTIILNNDEINLFTYSNFNKTALILKDGNAVHANEISDKILHLLTHLKNDQTFINLIK